MATPPEYRAAPEEEGATLRDYLGVIWRRKWVVILVTLVAAGAAFGFSAAQAPVYEAQADLIYEQQLNVSNPLTGQTYTDPTQRTTEMSAVNSVIHSPNITQRVATSLDEQGLPTSGYEVRAEVAQDDVSGIQSSSVLAVIATSGDAEYSAVVAQTFADEFVDWRKERLVSQIEAAQAAIQAEMRRYKGAAKDSSDYLLLQERLRDLQLLASTATGNFRVLVPAAAPSDPIEPQPLRSAILGFGVGLFAGIGLAFLLEQFDTRLRRPEEAADLLRQPILARVPRLSREQAKSPTLVTLSHPGDRVSEAFRLIRTNLAFMDVDAKAKSIMITSSLQGEGKSVTAANLAVTLALGGKKVIVVDADLRRPRQHRLFGVPNETGASTVAVGESELLSTLRSVDVVSHDGGGHADFSSRAVANDGVTRLWVLPSGPIPPNPGEIVASRRFAAMIQQLRDEADVVLVDSPAMLAVGDTPALASEVDGLIFLVDMEQARRPVLQAAADQLYRLPCALMGLVIRLQSGSRGAGYHYYYRYSEDGGSRRGSAPAATLAAAPTAQPTAQPLAGDGPSGEVPAASPPPVAPDPRDQQQVF